MKIAKKVLSLLISVLMIVSCITVGIVSVSAATGDTVYLKNSAGWSNSYCYMWTGNSGDNATWPGQAMTLVGDNIYSYTVPGDYKKIIFNNGDKSQTDDMDYPGNNYIYDNSTGKWEIYDLSAAEPSVSASKKNGASFKTDTLEVTVTASNADSSSYSIDGGSQVAFSGSATVTLGANTAVGGTTSITVTATNKNGTVTETYTYTKKDASQSGSISDGSTSSALDGYYGTNPNGGVGVRKTITVDGDKSDWDSSMLIAQGVANDDPRVYCHWSMHEKAYDDYALYAAWDNDNLYLMYEMANVQDIVAPQDDFPLSQGNLWIDNIPTFLYFYTGAENTTHGTTASGTLWDTGITFDVNVDHAVAYSTNASNGPFIYEANEDGNFGAEKYARTNTGINIKWGNGKTLSGTLYGVNKAGTDNGRVAGDTTDDSSEWVDFYSLGHNPKLDMFYEVSIPLEKLDITAEDIETNGIGILQVTTMGTSGMDCLPYDLSMQDNAAKEYSKDPSTSMEKEDEDHITVPFARIGKLLDSSSSSSTTTATQATTQATTATQATTTAPTTVTQPTTTVTEATTVTTEPQETQTTATTEPTTITEDVATQATSSETVPTTETQAVTSTVAPSTATEAITPSTETIPSVINPTESSSVVTDPTESTPVATDPTESTPVATDPTESTPVATDPTESTPVTTDPTESAPVATDSTESTADVTIPSETTSTDVGNFMFYVVGDEKLFGANWEKSASNGMTADNGIYYLTIKNAPAGTYEFKVLDYFGMSHTVETGKNSSVIVPISGLDVKFCYDPSKGYAIASTGSVPTYPTQSTEVTSPSTDTTEDTTSSTTPTETTDSSNQPTQTEATNPSTNPTDSTQTVAPPKISATTASLKAGGTKTLKVIDAAVKSWTSSNKKVATVKNGKITALTKGSTNITAVLSNGSKLTCKVKVTTNPKLSKSSVTVKLNKTKTITISGKAKGVNNTYTKTKYARITSAKSATKIKVKGLKKGSTKLTIKVNGKKFTLKVKVTK